jgi:hypothetical protein
MVLHVRRRVPPLRQAGHDAVHSEELTTLIEEEGNQFVVLWSPETAEHDPDYRELARFPSRQKALEFLSADG